MKNKYLKFLLALSVLPLSLCAQNFQWAEQFNKMYSAAGSSVSMDIDGNVYVVGGYYPEKGSSQTSGSFIKKYNANGIIEWSIEIDSSSISALELDKNGNPCFSGRIAKNVKIIDRTSVTGGGFFARLNSEGQIISFNEYRNIGSPKLKFDSEGNYFLAGTFRDTINFEDYSLYNSLNQGSFLYLAKFDSFDKCLWAYQTTSGHIQTFSFVFEIDSKNNLYVGGDFSGSVSFSNSISIKNRGSSSGFVAKFDSVGLIQWVQNIGSHDAGGGQEAVESFGIDSEENVYVTGWNDQPLQVGDFYLDKEGFGPIGFLLKFDKEGVCFEAQKTTIVGIVDVIRDTLFIYGSVGKAGKYMGIDLDPGNFSMVCDTEYNGIWAVQPTGNVSYRAFPDTKGNLFLTGNFQETANFGTLTLTANSEFDMFISKVSRIQSPTAVFNNTTQLSLQVYPNPSSGIIKLTIYNEEIFNLRAINTTGALMFDKDIQPGESTLDFSNFPKGIYFIEASNTKGKVIKKLVIQ